LNEPCGSDAAGFFLLVGVYAFDSYIRSNFLQGMITYMLVPLIGLLAILVYTYVYTNESIELNMNELKIRKVGNSLTVTVPVNIAAQMKVSEGDAVYLTELPGGGFRITPHDPELVEQMKTIEGLSKRYRNTLKALSE
jgi:putative addiction module antidote